MHLLMQNAVQNYNFLSVLPNLFLTFAAIMKKYLSNFGLMCVASGLCCFAAHKVLSFNGNVLLFVGLSLVIIGTVLYVIGIKITDKPES